MLKRYWLIVFPEDKFGFQNFGVTAVSAEKAKSLLKNELAKMGWSHVQDETIERAEVIENIDIRLLDENHVLPNMGVVSRQGVWFPNLNYY